MNFKTLSVFKTPYLHNMLTTFWNGNDMIAPSGIEVDVSVNTEAVLVFDDDSLYMRLEFNGNAALSYNDRVGLLNGQMNLVVDSTINGVIQSFKIGNSKSKAYSHINVGEPCQKKDNMEINGISFTASYEQQPGELFFTHLLRFTEITQRCSFEAFIPVNVDYRASGLRLYTECPLLALGELIFPEMSHTMSFIGPTNPECFQNDFLGVANAALLIESELINDHVVLGNILELQSNGDGVSDITTVFGRNVHDTFVTQLHSVQVTIFGGMFKTQASIRSNQLIISSNNGTVFGYPAELHITAFVGASNWENVLFTVEGNLKDIFIEGLLTVVKRKLTQLANSVNARLKIARMSLNQARERLKSTKETFNDAVSNLTRAEELRNAAEDDIQRLQLRLMEIELTFNTSQDDLQDEVEMLDGLCTEEFCEDVCMPAESCRTCLRPIFLTKTGTCPTIVKRTRRIRVPPFFTTVVAWRFLRFCRASNIFFCFSIFCPLSVRFGCTGRCVRVLESRPSYNWITVEENVLTFKSCFVTVFESSVPDTCCEEVSCAVFAPSPVCIMSNAMCRATRQNAAETIEGIREESRTLFQQLQEAQTNLSLARTAAKSAQVQYDIYNKRRNQLQMSVDRLEAANRTSAEVYERTLEEIGPLLGVSDSVTNDAAFQNIFEINSVTFITNITKSPTALDLNVVFDTQIGTSHEEYEEKYVYVSSQQKENFERIADDIIDYAFIPNSKRATSQNSRIGRQTTPETNQRDIFASRCAHISNIQHFLMEIHTKLMEAKMSIEVSRNSTTYVSQSLSGQGLANDEEFTAYLELIRSYEDLSMEALHTLESTIFSEWQASMEGLYSESASVGGFSCDGFADCLQRAVDELQNLINLTPLSELNEEFISVQAGYTLAKANALELALLSNISIDEGLVRIAPIIEITNVYVPDNYWCNEPPVLITDPPPEVNISLGGTLRLSCEAESDLAITYEWRRDGSTLPQFTTPELVITKVQRLDSANYTCFANNPVGSAESITTSVTVYELPQFYLLPESVVTYFGDDNGAWFACNASAWPYPGWKWFYRNSTNDEEWTLIEGEDTNELLILNPQAEHEGMYTCEAYNYHGSIRSEPVTLTLLPFTIAQQQFSLEFSIFMNTSHESQYCSLDDLYSTMHALIAETVAEQTSTIEDFNITQVDSVNYDITLKLLSTNATTHYLHLMTYAELANLALPHVTSLRTSTDLVTDLLGSNANYTCLGAEFSIVEDSLTVEKLTYVCPLGQRLNTDYLLCLSCEQGQFSTEAERSRIANGVGFSENVPVCEVCPLETYAHELGSTECLSCPKYHSTLSTGAASAEECLPQPLLLECNAISTGDHVTVTCKTNRPTQSTLCSFNNGLQHPCSYPMALNRDVSPLGNHSLTVFAEDDEGFKTEVTVHYFLEDDTTKPTAPALVPPLVVSFINDSPRVLADSVEIDILLSRPVQSLVCRLRGSTIYDTEADCSSGRAVFSALGPDVYILRVVATNRKPDKEFIKGRFEITNDTERCTLHLINSGVTITDDTATVEFTGRGPADGYHCRLDKMETYECFSPVLLSGLMPGIHQLKITPTGCGRNRMNLNIRFSVE